MTGQNYFDIPPEVAELSKNLEQLTIAYDQSIKDYQLQKQQIVMLEAKNAQLTREKEELEKQLNDMIIHTQAKIEQVKNLTIEVNSKLLYNIALDWQTPSPGSVFVCCDRDTGEVSLKTPEEMGGRKPTFRHWWDVKVCDVRVGGNNF